MLIQLFLFCLICGGSAQRFGLGHCPNIETISPFNITRYLGMWYENRRSIPNWFEFGAKCATATYCQNDDGSTKVINREISQVTDAEFTVLGTARPDEVRCENTTTCSKFIVEFPSFGIGKSRGPSWILDTDYTSYSIVWSCFGQLLSHFKFLWVLTREQSPSDAVIQRVEEIRREKGVDDIPMSITDQENCP